jgi:hypothetical protein
MGWNQTPASMLHRASVAMVLADLRISRREGGPANRGF